MTYKILSYGDAGSNTGFERVARNILTYLHNTGHYEIIHQGLGYNGNPDITYPYKVYPASTAGEYFGFENLPKLCERHKPDLIWSLQDLWHQLQYIVRKPVDIPYVGYFPVDTPNMKWSYGLALGGMTAPVAYTTFGATEAAASVRDGVNILYEGAKLKELNTAEPRQWVSLPHPESNHKLNCRLDYLGRWQNLSEWNVIPHGLDHGKFFPVDKSEARKQFEINEGDFIVGNINANQFRKQQDETIQMFAILAAKVTNAKLLLYCNNSNENGYDLHQLAYYYGIHKKVYFVHDFVNEISDTDLNLLYNCCDVMINTSGGEGWGLCLGPSTLIHTPERVLPITRIRPGDRVLSSDGTFRRVRATTHRTVTDWLDVDVAGHPTTQVTPEHPFLAIQDASLGNAKTRKAAYTPAWVPVGQLKPGDYVAVGQLGTASSMPATVDLATVLPEGWEHDADAVWHPMGFAPDASCTSITELMAACGETKKVVEKALGVVKGRREPGTSERVAEVVAHVRDNGLAVLEARRYPRHVPLTDELLEVLGWYLAEGSTYDACAAVEWSLNGLTEHAVAERIATVVQQHFGVPATIRVRDGVQAGSRLEVQVSAAPVAHFFAALGGRGAHAKQLHAAIPLTDARILAVWRGLFRGDGHVADNGTTALGIASGALCAQVQLSLRALGIISTYRVHERPTGQVVHKLLLSRSQASRFWETGYAARQADTLPAYGGHRWARVRAVQPRTGTLQVYDLSIEDTHSFVGNNLIVHNTSMESAACGIPQVVPDWSATREIWKDHGVLLPVLGYRAKDAFLNTMLAFLNIEEGGNRLIKLAQDRDFRESYSKKAMALAAAQPSWKDVGRQFEFVIRKSLATFSPPAPLSLDDVVNMRQGVVESELKYAPYLKDGKPVKVRPE